MILWHKENMYFAPANARHCTECIKKTELQAMIFISLSYIGEIRHVMDLRKHSLQTNPEEMIEIQLSYFQS